MRRMKNIPALAGILLLLAAVCAAALPALAGRMEIRKPAYERVLEYEAEGFSVKDDIQIGELARGASYYFNAQLTTGIDYFFHFQGDQGVNRVRLVIFDEQWNVVDVEETTAEGQAAVVRLRPEWTGTYHVKATLLDCNADFDFWFILAGYR
ncbi:MAG: hypothetical protein AB7D51_01875 [Desulfovibrionaceae bacterium]